MKKEYKCPIIFFRSVFKLEWSLFLNTHGIEKLTMVHVSMLYVMVHSYGLWYGLFTHIFNVQVLFLACKSKTWHSLFYISIVGMWHILPIQFVLSISHRIQKTYHGDNREGGMVESLKKELWKAPELEQDWET